MIIEQKQNLSFDELDELVRPAPEVVEFEEVAHRMVSRRGFLSGGAAVGASAFVMGSTTLAAGNALAAAETAESRLAFSMVKANTLDTITVPEGYKWEVVASWGDPLFSNAPAFDPMTGGTGASQELAFGDHNDGMAFFVKDGKQIMAINNEYTNEKTLHANRADGMPINADDVRKNKAAHGVSIIEVDQRGGKWGIVQDSPYNRRITADTEMDITGPARGHKWMQTSEDPKGVVAKGTWNNCGNGQTPWGTYLTCEENFNGYFTASKDFKMPDDYKRYGVSNEGRYNWALSDDRFNLDKEPNEPNRFGYIVEIDPLDPTSRPKKRTALGRFKHENAELTIAANGHVVVYLGDDERGEFLYRFVSKHKYLAGGNNRDLLEEGTLYVAKFHDNNRGEWLALTPKTTGMTEAEIAIHTRMAASKVGATTMDRPEWVASHPHKVEAYCALTNNSNRGVKPNAGGDETPAVGPNPRVKNNFGQIVRWMPMNEDHTSAEFKWDLFVLAGNPAVYTDANAGSKNINQDNMFNSPDGLKFDSKGLLWIQTDGNYSNEKDFQGQGNNQMLVGDPETGEIRRFLVGPKECEITGLAWNASKTTMFISVQHPGEDGNSHWPNGGQSVPRSSVVAISREDGAVIG
ncbi:MULTISPECIES: PhoX family protein [Marinomonas]|uniref:PhoX family phosphatase n=1 Tax=Marinomonas arctica TaxID=383750 RepID=A0A7H1J330_9GAMM|nr:MULTISPECIES: PhoX family phosphatase [Marinomonas]MCS7485870.1 transcriptional initiation protein Tat [Marinomonas sp. BSi20414]QNT04896.1 PhoX family phosphatase [Marinomonas arctica]GGN17703.1 transcriptional initiation protein Tat [Marinomonas arctica]